MPKDEMRFRNRRDFDRKRQVDCHATSFEDRPITTAQLDEIFRVGALRYGKMNTGYKIFEILRQEIRLAFPASEDEVPRATPEPQAAGVTIGGAHPIPS